jgi:hypothetical protein
MPMLLNICDKERKIVEWLECVASEGNPPTQKKSDKQLCTGSKKIIWSPYNVSIGQIPPLKKTLGIKRESVSWRNLRVTIKRFFCYVKKDVDDVEQGGVPIACVN